MGEVGVRERDRRLSWTSRACGGNTYVSAFGFDLVLRIRRKSSRGYELCFQFSEVIFNRLMKDIRPQIQEYVYTGESGRISLLSPGGPL